MNGNDLVQNDSPVSTDDFSLFRGKGQDAQFRSSAAGVAALLASAVFGGTEAAPTIGQVTLDAGTASAISAAASTSSSIFLSRQDAAGTLGHLSIENLDAGGFDVVSDSATETSTVNWLIVNPT